MQTLIDIGSMKGEEIKLAIEHDFDVYAFEPNPNMKEFLIPFESYAHINYAAAWNEDGVANLYMMFNPEPGQDGVSLVKEKVNVSQENVIEVPTINIGKYLKNLDKDIDILKINAEGAEYIILESILENFDHKRIKIWAVEDHYNYIEDEVWRKKRSEVLQRLDNLGVTITPWNNTTRHELLG